MTDEVVFCIASYQLSKTWHMNMVLHKQFYQQRKGLGYQPYPRMRDCREDRDAIFCFAFFSRYNSSA